MADDWQSEDKASPESMRKLKELLSHPDNQLCADCRAPHPKWASTNIGVFICIKCSGVHRSLGVDISRVISLTLDTWTDDQVELMLAVGGNDAANATYEAYAPHNSRPPSNASVQQRSDWIRRKYEDQEFLTPSLRIGSSVTMKHSRLSSIDSNSSETNTHSDDSSLNPKPPTSHSGKPKLTESNSNRQRPSRSSTMPPLDRINSGMVEFIGLLKIMVLKGRDLAVRDVLTSDPYVKAILGWQSQKTHVVKSNLNPVWNQELMVSVPEQIVPLKLQVFDYDTFSADDIMGEAEVDVNPMVEAARMYEGVEIEVGRRQIGKWLATSDNALVRDSEIWLSNGRVTQEMSLKLQHVESGELDIALEWVPLTQ
ncbi:stromal membrane-associated protein [Marchantia polymorpha subsp. ruderalis]|uniref:Arf-GAP domain-containing protein n=2 Tax=Marchantia polymorpha TaxID=3197 RepID=A0A176VJY6_MARPO|nr:hypothetical protein AXG93_868s1060 [Marchantia polymorpha subsp. ruderalis]PTQ43601.1 hypothetical protein MARPO_0024s0103 [Marchantia polymorpha]BBN06700.1 hypothetical protein Mp_3g23260 [Marchantia polymorpha subsp. ruderalis]|eukprot:PTQ43601.1 hypothetical protein MARPO_0024s0103 [Marchantia polymorpha]